jgi:hypothetical protein
MSFKTLSKIFVTVALSFTLTGCSSGEHNKFVPTGKMITDRSGHHGFLLANGEVALVSGSIRPPYQDTVENYDPKTGKFRIAGKMQFSRIFDTATLLKNGKILITGGQNSFLSGRFSEGSLASAEVYDPNTGESHYTGNMHVSRINHQATLLNNGKVLITGGGLRPRNQKELRQIWKDKVEFTYASTELFDPQTETFTPAANMHDKRDGHQATLLQDGNVLVTGGNYHLKPLDSAEIYLAKENRFVQLPKMIYPRVRHSTLLLPDGQVLIVGGQTTGEMADKEYGDTVIKQVELFSPAKKQFGAGGSLQNPVGGESLIILLPNGKVLIMSEKLTQLYDPKKYTTEYGPERLYKFGGYSAVRLADGDILVTSGYNSYSIGQESMELYKF